MLIAALGYFAYDKFVLEPARDAELVQTTTRTVTEQAASSASTQTVDKSIAVLAFADLSPDGDQEYFCDGISEELLNVLSRVPGLQVAARTSSFRFKNETRDAIEIGEKLGVAYVLEGSVRKSGDQIRITAQLIDTKSGFQLWSNTYNRQLENIFEVQDAISAAIVEALNTVMELQIGVAPQATAAVNTEAHEAYLRGRHLVVRRGASNVDRAIREFEKAIELDPDYAIAYAELTIAILLQRQYDRSKFPMADIVARAGPHAERALALDSTLAEAHAATAWVLWFEYKRDEALARFGQAIRINPNYADVYTWMANIFTQIGNYKESFAAQEMSVRLNPLFTPAINNYSINLIRRNRLDEAEQELEKLAALSPAAHKNIRAVLAYARGQSANAILANLDALQLSPGRTDWHGELSYQFAGVGLESEALAISEHPRPVTLSLLGRQKDAVTVAEARLQMDLETIWLRRELGVALAGAGDYVRARPILEDMWRRSRGRIGGGLYSFFRAETAAALIAILRDAGDIDGVSELVAAMRDNVRRYREAGINGVIFWNNVDYEEGLADYLSGDRQKGLALIAKAVGDGMVIPQGEAYLKELYDDPGFAPIREMQEARQARERAKFLAVVCTDNPYAAVWQPAEGTCERFATVDAN